MKCLISYPRLGAEVYYYCKNLQECLGNVASQFIGLGRYATLEKDRLESSWVLHVGIIIN